MVVMDREFSLLSSTGSSFHLGPFGHQGMPKSQTPRFFPKLHLRTTEPDLSPALPGAELTAATPNPFPMELLTCLACLGRYLSPKMEQESKKRYLGVEVAMGERVSLVETERKWVRQNRAGIIQARTGLQTELQEEGSVALRALCMQIPYLGIFLEKSHHFHQLLTQPVIQRDEEDLT